MNWQHEFEHCIDKRWLVRMPEARYLVTKELEVAQDDLAEAEAGYERRISNGILRDWRTSQPERGQAADQAGGQIAGRTGEAA